MGGSLKESTLDFSRVDRIPVNFSRCQLDSCIGCIWNEWDTKKGVCVNYGTHICKATSMVGRA